jgi:hypothetical protein
VLRQKRPYSRKQEWVPVSLFDSENHYRGPAVFESKEDAENYMEIYNHRMQQQQKASLNPNKTNNRGQPMQELRLQIFAEDKLPPVNFPIFSGQ